MKIPGFALATLVLSGAFFVNAQTSGAKADQPAPQLVNLTSCTADGKQASASFAVTGKPTVPEADTKTVLQTMWDKTANLLRSDLLLGMPGTTAVVRNRWQAEAELGLKDGENKGGIALKGKITITEQTCKP